MVPRLRPGGVMRQAGVTLALALFATVLGACSSRSGSGVVGPGASATVGASVAAPATASTPAPRSAAPPPLIASPERVPLVLVHGIDSRPEDFESFLRSYETGRPVIRALYAAEADRLAPGSLPSDVVVAFGFYKETASGPVTTDASIGGCPVARTDGLASRYPSSYAERLRRCVEGLRRATGAPKVDLVLHSMGGIVGRAYTKWLSLDARGDSAVRRIFTIGSPWRGVNALEASASAFSHTGPDRYRRLGECLELCREARFWGGQSFIERLDDDWDGFCAAHGLEYAGLSLLGEHGAPAGMNPTAPAGIPPTHLLPDGTYATGRSWALQLFVKALGAFTPADLAELPLLPLVLSSLVSESAEALGDGDGVVRLESSRLDAAPFARAAFFGLYEGGHANLPDPERGFASSYAVECVRAFCLDSGRPAPASCRSLDVAAIRAPGRATWLEVAVDVDGDGALAVQVVEEPLDAHGQALYAIGYGAPLRPGQQTLAFAVVPGGGTRRYRVQVYGPRGPIALRDGLVVTLDDGAIDPPPAAAVVAVSGTAARAEVSLGAAGAADRDPALAFRSRIDGGAWSSWSSDRTLDVALAPGLHRLEVVARSAANGAARLVEQGAPTGVGLRVDANGAITLVR